MILPLGENKFTGKIIDFAQGTAMLGIRMALPLHLRMRSLQ
jgi:hypothetical protein